MSKNFKVQSLFFVKLAMLILKISKHWHYLYQNIHEKSDFILGPNSSGL